MPTTDHPAAACHCDSARLENRGPLTTTRVVGPVVEAVVDGVRPAPGAVDHLVRDHDGAGAELGTQRPDRARREHLAHPDRPQRPEVRAVAHLVRREAVVAAVARDERHAAATHRADHRLLAGRAERGPDLDLAGVVEEGVEPGTADDPDVRA